MDIEQAIKIYSEIVGWKVTPDSLKNERVNHPLGQMFWRKDEISDADFEKYLSATIGRQVSASEINDAKLAAMADKSAAKQAARAASKEESGSPMGW
jgi:hypothetical protein